MKKILRQSTIIGLTVSLFASCVYASKNCTTPQELTKVANLYDTTFNNRKFTCDNGNIFTLSRKLVCQGDKYYQEHPLDQLTTLEDGSKRYAISVLEMKEGHVTLVEHIYKDGESYAASEKALSIEPFNFKILSDRAMMFYAKDTTDNFLAAVWYIDENKMVKGYKLHTDKAVSCISEAIK